MSFLLQSIPFEDRQRALLNWTNLERALPGAVLSVLAVLLRSSPDPDTALNYFERFLSNAPSRVASFLTRDVAALNVLVPIFSHSHYLAETLVSHSEYAEWLYRDRRREFIKSKEDLMEDLSRFESTLTEVSLPEVLVRFKRREYLRIALRDVAKMATLAETAWELSVLAEVILEKALQSQRLTNRFGTPQFMDSSGRIGVSELVVLALGKLGGGELNYSSDIDLLFLYSEDGETSGVESVPQSRISNQEFFIKAASVLSEAVSQVTPSGWAFRVDLRLRPHGKDGFLARSLKSAVEYYRDEAEPWELQALLKARPVAGKMEVGKRFLSALQERIYPQEGLETIALSIDTMRQKIDAKLRQADVQGFNVKLERGTIRDIEFLTQCLQRIFGAQDAWVRESNTLLALQRLHDNNHITRTDFVVLAGAYEFFRILEHRLQLEHGLQTHTLPDNPQTQRRLAVRMGFTETRSVTSRDALLHAIEHHQNLVIRIYRRLIGERGAYSPDLAPGDISSVAASDRTSELAKSQEEVAALSKVNARLAALVDEVAVEARFQNSFNIFLSSLNKDVKAISRVKPKREWTPQLQVIFDSGEAVSEMAARDALFTLNYLKDPGPKKTKSFRKRRCLDVSSVRILKARGRSQGQASDAVPQLRAMVRRRTLNLLIHDILDLPDLQDTLTDFSALAGEAIGGALRIAFHELWRKHPKGRKKQWPRSGFPFAIFALGRLGTCDMDLGSDLDLLFVCDYASWEAAGGSREIPLRLAEAVVSILTSYTREGPIYPVDLRLRPHGQEGELVQGTTQLFDYFSTQAQIWEYSAYLRLRPVGGNLRWGAKLAGRLKKMIFEEAKNRPIAPGLLEVRSRIEQAAESADHKFDFKSGPGGIYDIEFALAHVHLTRSLPVKSGESLFGSIRQARNSGLLSAPTAGLFEAALKFYRFLDHCIRLHRGKSHHLLDPQLWEEIPAIRRHLLELHIKAQLPLNAGTDVNGQGLIEICREMALMIRKGMNETMGNTVNSDQ
ncbi:MAG: hypothetical protein PHX83_09445 [Acidobacteriia bacterium]|nr:hypothetical protein [Terriglobia bacterium]